MCGCVFWIESGESRLICSRFLRNGLSLAVRDPGDRTDSVRCSIDGDTGGSIDGDTGDTGIVPALITELISINILY